VTNLPAAEKFIHFQLNQMSPRNEHHRFEEICFRIARRRISSNVKLASGPVSAGGDQGRDVESYVTWLPEQLPHAKGFVARASDKPVIVACTLQKDNLARKAKDDVAKICEPGAGVAGGTAGTTGGPDPVDYILFCSVVAIPTAKQHELQQWARETYGVRLDFFDGLVLSAMLAEVDLVWIAQEYLDLASNLVPDYPGEDPAPQWYSDLLARCRRGEVTALTPGDLAQIRPGLRFATRDDDARTDLPEWLGNMALFLVPDSSVSDEVAMRARYEIAVAHIRGLESLTAVESAIRDFIRFASQSASLALLEDAQVLLMYFGGAMARGLDEDSRTVTPAELSTLHTDLEAAASMARAGTDSETHPVRYTRLLRLEALLALHPAYDRVMLPPAESVAGAPANGTSDEPSAPALMQEREDLDNDEEGDDDEVSIPPEWLVDVDRAMTLLVELVDRLPQVPAFPVESLSQQFDLLAPVLVDQPGYGKVRDGLDSAVERLEGDAAAAHKCRNRALTFVKVGRPLDALREFHAAKEKWWHGDTLRGSLLAMRMIASIYSSLDMTLAAKQYRLTAVSLALTSDKDELGEMAAGALLDGMNAAYQQGLWLDAAGLARIAVLARNALVADAFDYDKHAEDLAILDFEMATCVHAARAFWPGLEHVVMTAVGTTGWEDGLLEVVEETAKAWSGRDEETFLRGADEELSGTPFGDAGPTRTITFAALGTRWYVEVANERLAVLAAERFCAAAQILLCEMVDLDPLLVPQDVRVQVSIGKPLGTEDRVEVQPNNDGLECKVFLTPYSDGLERETLERETFTILARMLFSMSMRRDSDVLAIIDSAAESGLLGKLNVGRPYDEVANLLDAEHYDACRGAQIADRAVPYRPVEVDELAAASGPGPGYERDESLRAVASRYENVSDIFSLTLGRVLSDARVRAILDDLRAEGWLDWHLVAAVASVATNARAARLGYYGPHGINRKAINDLFHTKETAESLVVPLEMFDENSLRMALQLNAMTVAGGFGLTPPTQTPNLEATLDMMRERYGYGTDDVPHLDLLGEEILNEQGRVRPMLVVE
jgi:hypothetical protein